MLLIGIAETEDPSGEEECEPRVERDLDIVCQRPGSSCQDRSVRSRPVQGRQDGGCRVRHWDLRGSREDEPPRAAQRDHHHQDAAQQEELPVRGELGRVGERRGCAARLPEAAKCGVR
ncbi:unnamed protein product [Linum tenue]|uniref:Uncharacterized protein n=1 Tax=Linum tenue TaxID=586396 RepID=A0AAV0MZ56_9ROSI|nr:unnamed protein product [Linum tenue]